MLQHGIKRVPILRDGVLVGIVSRADVVRAVVENVDNLLEPTEYRREQVGRTTSPGEKPKVHVDQL
jgi:CBS domain-containing protein